MSTNRPKAVRFSWKRDPEHDLLLLTEVESNNPFAFKRQRSVWEDIATNLQKCALKMKVTARSCRERTLELIAAHRRDETQSARASGISEDDASEMDKLLISISKLEADKEQPSKLKTLYSKSGRAEAEKIRQDALDDMNQVSDEDQEVAAAPNTQEERSPSDEEKELETPKRARRSNGKRELISFLERKSELELEVKKEEIRIREREAENKRLELEILKTKNDADIQERKLMTELLVKLVSKP